MGFKSTTGPRIGMKDGHVYSRTGGHPSGLQGPVG